MAFPKFFNKQMNVQLDDSGWALQGLWRRRETGKDREVRRALQTENVSARTARRDQPRANSSPVPSARGAELGTCRIAGARSGMTLIELLVVVVILTTLLAAALPILAPADSDRAIREATRGLNTFITGAQARAIELKRPYGIALKKLSADTGRSDPTAADNDNSVCVEVYYVEQAAPYTGFDDTSAVMVALDNGPKGGGSHQVIIRFVRRGSDEMPNVDSLPVGYDPDLLPSGVLRRGDIIEVAGTRYRFIDDGPTVRDANGFYVSNPGNPPGSLIAIPINNTGQQISPEYDKLGRYLLDGPANPELPYFTVPMPYKVLRQPTPTSAEPYQLPAGVAIDLRASGIGTSDFFYVPGLHDNSFAPMIMFTPEGRVERVTFNQQPYSLEPFDEPVVDNVYLLLGRRENVPAPLPSDDPTLLTSRVTAATTDEARAELREPVNWLRDDSRWVVIGSQSGRIVSVENSFVDLSGTIATFMANNHPLGPSAFAESSEQMRNAQIYESREFTREMSQLGGR